MVSKCALGQRKRASGSTALISSILGALIRGTKGVGLTGSTASKMGSMQFDFASPPKTPQTLVFAKRLSKRVS